MKHNASLDMAGVSAIGHLMAIIIVGFVGICVYYVIMAMQPMFTGLSQDASNTIYILELGLDAFFVLFLIAVILSHYINEKNNANAGV